MIRKTLLGAAAVALLGGFVFGRDLFSYVKTSAKSVREAVKREVPLEFEVARARDMVEDLIPDIRAHVELIAEDEVEVERFQEQIAQKEKGLRRQEQAILSLHQDLKSGDSTFSYASRTFTSDDVKRDLKDRLERCKSAKESLERDRKILAHREKALWANKQTLDEMLLAKKDLEVKVEQLSSRLDSLRAAEAADSNSIITFDDSQLARTKKLIAELNQQLDVREKVLDAEGKFAGLIPVETEIVDDEVPTNITEEINEYFSPQDEAADEVADTVDGQPTL
jgi:chromosome segregation ATPase